MAPVMGVQCRIGIKKETTEGTAVTVDTLLELISGDIGLVEEGYHAAGMAGSRSRSSARTRANTRKVSGSITLVPNAAEWAVLLPWILGADASGTSFALAETCPSYTVVMDKDNGTDGKTLTYNGCKVAKAVISTEAGGPLQCQLDVEGWDESIGNAGTFPSLTLNTAAGGPFMCHDSAAALTVGGTAFPYRRMSITVDNMLDTERFLNAATRAALPAKDRVITVELSGPYGGKETLYPTAATLAAGVAVVATFTHTVTAVSIAITCPKVHFPRKTPPWNGREEVDLPLAGEARWSSAVNDELSVVLDSTA